jgi:formyltetrahydrofolate deformylase
MPLARKGVVAAISQFLIAHNGSVLHSDDHLDSGRDLFLSRLEWDLDGFDIPISDFEHHFKPVSERYRIHYHLALTDYRPKIAILVSGHDHCLADLLYRHRAGDLACDIVAIISNHPTAKPLADFHHMPFHLLTNPQDKRVSEQEMLERIALGANDIGHLEEGPSHFFLSLRERWTPSRLETSRVSSGCAPVGNVRVTPE